MYANAGGEGYTSVGASLNEGFEKCIQKAWVGGVEVKKNIRRKGTVHYPTPPPMYIT